MRLAISYRRVPPGGVSLWGTEPQPLGRGGVRSVYNDPGIQQEYHVLCVVQHGTHQDMIARELDRDSTAPGRQL